MSGPRVSQVGRTRHSLDYNTNEQCHDGHRKAGTNKQAGHPYRNGRTA
ncbi:hypothetical protein GCM10009543_17400 [Leifsonia naganoensis]